MFYFLQLINSRVVNAEEVKKVITVDAEQFYKLVARTEELEERLRELEGRAVLSEPELIVKKKKILVCDNGHEYDDRLAGNCPLDNLPLKKSFTYQREKLFRRQTISTKIEEALAAEAEKSVSIGVSATGTVQSALHLNGNKSEANGDVYGVGSTDIFFIAKPAIYTMFFADIETIGGLSPDDRISNISSLNGDSARLVNDKEINLREAWVRTELFEQKLALSAGMLDLTNYFDANMAANDETSQFITDTLVNNPLLGVPSNGGGIVGIYDTKNGIKLKAGIQRGENAIKNISEKTYSLVEVEYLSHFGSLPEGNYRLWYRINENINRENTAWGISADQKVTPAITLFARFGQQFTSSSFDREDYFYSGGIQFKTPHTFNLEDTIAIGYQRTDLAAGIKESLLEGYYNLFLTDNLKTSFHLQYLIDSNVGGESKSYLIPGMRVQVDF